MLLILFANKMSYYNHENDQKLNWFLCTLLLVVLLPEVLLVFMVICEALGFQI